MRACGLYSLTPAIPNLNIKDRALGLYIPANRAIQKNAMRFNPIQDTL